MNKFKSFLITFSLICTFNNFGMQSDHFMREAMTTVLQKSISDSLNKRAKLIRIQSSCEKITYCCLCSSLCCTCTSHIFITQTFPCWCPAIVCSTSALYSAIYISSLQKRIDLIDSSISLNASQLDKLTQIRLQATAERISQFAEKQEKME
jgi:hypothetical protein